MKLARAWGFIAVLSVGSAALGGCREPLGGVRPLATPVAGYRALVEADEPWTGLERTWRFGDGTSETGMSLVAHTWEKPGIYDVRASAGRHGFWESQVEVRAPGEPVDLAELLGTGPKGATATVAIMLYRPEHGGSYCLLEDATVVDHLLRLVGDAQAVAQSPRGTRIELLFFQLLGPAGQYLGQLDEASGIIRVSDSSGQARGGYLLRAPLAELVPAGMTWKQGRVVNGLVAPVVVIPPLPLTALPDSCLAGEPGLPAEGSVVEAYSLRTATGLTIASLQHSLVKLDSVEQKREFDYVLALLAACPPATSADLAGLPQDYWTEPYSVVISFAGDEPVEAWVTKQVMWTTLPSGDLPDATYRVAPELETFARALLAACGR